MERIKEIIEKVFPLPKPEDRKEWLLPIKIVHPGFKVTNDGEYLGYLLLKIMLIVSFSLMTFLLVDISFGTNVLIAQNAFQSNKLLLSNEFVHLIRIPAITLLLIFYLRFRLINDIRNVRIPIIGNYKILVKNKRRSWIWVSSIIIVAGLILVFLTHISVMWFARRHDISDNLFWIIAFQIFVAVAVSFGPVLLFTGLLTLEKSIRFFPEAYTDLLSRGMSKKGY